MAYQSIFAPSGQVDLGKISSSFVPGQYGKINAQIAATKTPTVTTPNLGPSNYNSVMPKLPTPKNIAGTTTPASGFLNKAETYGRALITSPGTTVSRIATGQGVQRVDNGAIISARLPYAASTQIKQNEGGFKTVAPTNLDHRVSLEIGGTNQQKNLRVVPAAQNAFDASNVEDYLGTALKDNLVNAKDAQNLELQYKAGKITPQQIYDQVNSKSKAAPTGLPVTLGKVATKLSSTAGTVANDATSVYQHLNPFSGVHQTNNFIGTVQKDYGLTPQFVQTLHNAGASVSNKSLSEKGSDAPGAVPAGEQTSQGANKIELSSTKGDTTTTPASSLIHEGLHQEWQNNPQDHQSFINTFNKAATPDLKSYLDSRLEGYQGYQGVNSLNNLQKAPAEIQNEVHSMTGQYYLTLSKPTNDALTSYYSKYFNVAKGQQAESSGMSSEIQNALKAVPKGVSTNNLELSTDNNGNPIWITSSGKTIPIPSTVFTPSTANNAPQTPKIQNIAQLKQVNAPTVKAESNPKNTAGNMAPSNAVRTLTGGSVNQLANALYHTPQMIGADISNNPVAQANTQEKTFGTTNSGNIAKKIIGSTVGTGSLVVGGPEALGLKDAGKAGVGALIKKGVVNAGIGAAGNTASTLTTNPNANGKQLLKSALVGGGAGLALTGAGAVANKAASHIQGILHGINTPFTNHVYQAVASHLDTLNGKENAATTAYKGAIDHLNGAEQFAKSTAPSSQKLLAAGNPQKLLEAPKPQTGFTISSQENQRIMNGTEKLATQYTKEYNQLTKTFAGSPKRLSAETEALDQKYIGRHNDLLNGTGGFDQSTPKGTTSLGKAIGSAKQPFPTPRSAFDKQTPVETTSTPTEAPATTPKTTPVASTPKVSTTPTTPKPVIPENGPRISGSALKSESRAVQKGLVSDLGEKATYSGGSYKQEADKAVQLVHDNPDEAKQIALGNKPGNNTIHEVAVRRAVENKALQSGDTDTLRQLANSSQHTATSEAAQRLGAEGFNADHNSPVQAIREVNASREEALGSRTGQNADRVTESTVKDIQKTAAPKLKVSRQDWNSFIESLRC